MYCDKIKAKDLRTNYLELINLNMVINIVPQEIHSIKLTKLLRYNI